MDAVIGVLSVIGFIASLVLIVVFAIKKKKVYPPLISLVCCFAVFLVCVALPDSPSTLQTPNGGIESTPNEPTEEDKAAELLAKADYFFEKGNYADGISTCKSLQESYPDTAVAIGVPDFLADRFARYQTYSAESLMDEYVSNVVNADKNITGNVVVVSGVISSITKTNHDTNLAVIMESSHFLRAVQLNFSSAQEDAVAELNPGDSIKAIGKCEGLSGKIMVVLDSKANVMVINCYIIG